MMRKLQVRVFDGVVWESVFIDCMGGIEDFLFSTNDVLVFVTDMRNVETWSASTPATFKFAVGTRHEYDGYIFEAGFVEQQSWDEEALEVLLQLGDEYHIY